MKKIPETGIPGSEILKCLSEMKKGNVKWEEGKVWSLVYYLGEEHKHLLEDAFSIFSSENYLNPLAFPGIHKMEKEIVSMSLELFNGNEQASGCITSGGTESIFLAVYSSLKKALKKRKFTGAPEILATPSLHPAFEKAAEILGLKIVRAKLFPDHTLSIPSLINLLGPNTFLIAASAPGFPHGTMDPIEEIGKIAQSKQLAFHVDACVGGFMLPWVKRIGYKVPKWNFEVPGVTSISADVHKFGFGMKGVSLVLYKNSEMMANQFFVGTDWQGGAFATTTFLGSRSGGPIAAAWAAMHKLGAEGYMDIAKKLMNGKEKLIESMNRIPEIEIIGKPVMNIFAFRTKNNSPNIFAVADLLEEKGWSVDRVQHPHGIHISVLHQNLPVLEKYLNDLAESIQAAKTSGNGEETNKTALYGAMSKSSKRSSLESTIRKTYLDLYRMDSNPEGEREPF